MTAKATKVAPIPRGYRSITPYITTPDVKAAVALYQAALSATIVSTIEVPDTGTTVFAQIRIGNSQLAVGQGETPGAGTVSLHHYVEDAEATWTAARTAGFTELSGLQDTYWGDRIGLMIDPLGVQWSIGQRVERVTAEEIRDRATLAMGYAGPTQADDGETDTGTGGMAVKPIPAESNAPSLGAVF